MWAARTRGADDVDGSAYVRASSTSAAVPLASSSAPGPAPVSSRCASTTIASDACPPATAQRFWSRSVPCPGTCWRHESDSTGSPYGRNAWRNQSAALSASALPGTRLGYSLERSAASCRVAAPSKAGGRIGAGSGDWRTTLKAAIRSGNASTRNALR